MLVALFSSHQLQFSRNRDSITKPRLLKREGDLGIETGKAL